MRAIKAPLVWNGEGFSSDHCLVIEDDRIVGVTSSPPPDAEIEEWGDVAIVPGSVNAHGHSFQNLLKGFADDRTFESWRDDVLYPFAERLSPDDIYAGAVFAFAEAALAGVTTIVDFFYLHDESNENAERVLAAARDVGIRLVFARTFYDVDAPTRAPIRFRETAEDSATRFEELARAHESDPMISIQAAPHSLHAASPETIAIALDVTAAAGVRCHLHLAEARYEVEQVKERYGATPVRLLAREGLLRSHLVTVHTVWVDDEELDLLAGAGVGVVHCPGANAFLGDGIARVPEMLERGIRVALGPDGGCANNRQSVFDEMRMASLVAKARLVDGSALGAMEAFRLGTVAGGDLLGLPVGGLREGDYADLVALDLNDISLHPLATLERQVVHSMQSTAIKRVMVGGRVIAEEGRLSRVPLGRVRELVATATKGWVRP
ncbi:MAG: 5-methylthioadenosine/S-adenosylhomocysteine deaminase [Actinomycetota bacterium]|nr:5-methylthioadenosine/S-adenosylhomocysteine deaminase [Actinomycetota bacterium]